MECPLYRTKEFKQHYLRDVMSDSLGYAGTEIIRRVVGDSKVMEVTSIKETDKRVAYRSNLYILEITLMIADEVIKNREQMEVV